MLPLYCFLQLFIFAFHRWKLSFCSTARLIILLQFHDHFLQHRQCFFHQDFCTVTPNSVRPIVPLLFSAYKRIHETIANCQHSIFSLSSGVFQWELWKSICWKSLWWSGVVSAHELVSAESFSYFFQNIVELWFLITILRFFPFIFFFFFFYYFSVSRINLLSILHL